MILHLFPLENQFAVVRTDFDFISWLELAFEQANRKRIENVFLQGALERTRVHRGHDTHRHSGTARRQNRGLAGKVSDEQYQG